MTYSDQSATLFESHVATSNDSNDRSWRKTGYRRPTPVPPPYFIFGREKRSRETHHAPTRQNSISSCIDKTLGANRDARTTFRTFSTAIPFNAPLDLTGNQSVDVIETVRDGLGRAGLTVITPVSMNAVAEHRQDLS